MWIVFALLSAVFAGTNVILARYGVRKTDPVLVTSLRTVVVLGLSFGAVAVSGAWKELNKLDAKGLVILLLAGTLTGVSWLCYFRALASGGVNRVAAVDKFSAVFTILGGWLFLNERMNSAKIVAMVLISVGALLMINLSNTIDKQELGNNSSRRISWLVWALASVLSVSAATLLSKMGVRMIPSELALAIRTGFVLILTWIVAYSGGKLRKIKDIQWKSFWFILLSGLATGLGWICYFRALRGGEAGVVLPIDKLSILVTVLLSRVFFKEKLRKTEMMGLGLLTAGILLLIYSNN